VGEGVEIYSRRPRFDCLLFTNSNKYIPLTNTLDQCLPNFLLAGPFWLRKINTDPHILVHVTIECLEGRYPKLKIYILEMVLYSYKYAPVKSSPITGLEWPRGSQEVKVPRFHDNGTGWW
jgi:hypothetical protein